ncbi:MAG: glycosyltransferase family 92 protein [Acetobacter sp.]|nr:glycosyltransferase family 92 protein [Acetobacter sp.]
MKKIIVAIVSLLIIATLTVVNYTLQKPYYLSVAAIMKNEKPYLKEWLEYHLMQGVEHFYLCDNDSTDGTEEYLKPYIDKGIITYIKQSGVNQQLVCYEKIVREYQNDTTWLAIIDLDEYLVPLQAPDMPTLLKEFEDVAEVSLHWMNYGDSNAVNRSDGLITEFFTSHGRFLNHTVKSIVRPEKVVDFTMFGSNHYVRVSGKSVNEYHKPVEFMLNFNISADKARVNHYILKSFAEFLHKKGRGHPEGTPIDFEYYFFHNDNEITNDTSMLRFLPKLKERMIKSPLADVAIPQVENLPKNHDEILFTPVEAAQVLGYPINAPITYKELEQAYKNRHPQYKK